MFTTCIHCNTDLGRNEAFEAFPVGSRLAFDAAHGRLWVICRSCGRWNLSPLDERWETIEEAEKRFRDSRLRVSTDNVGLARLREGVDLIRIGEPQRPEMAAWRYGDQFGTRRKRQMMITGAVLGSATVIAGGMVWIGVSIGSFAGIYANGSFLDMLVHGRPRTSIGHIALPDGRVVEVLRKHARMSTLERNAGDQQMALRLESVAGTHLLVGGDALRATARLMPTVNRFGGSIAQVQDAVALLDEIGDPIRVLQTLQMRHGASDRSERWKRVPKGFYRGTEQVKHVHGALHTLRPNERLALEMALHEESEHRAMNGELAQLDAAWREAEEIANIADNMFVLPTVDAQLAEMRQRASPDVIAPPSRDESGS